MGRGGDRLERRVAFECGQHFEESLLAVDIGPRQGGSDHRHAGVAGEPLPGGGEGLARGSLVEVGRC